MNTEGLSDGAYRFVVLVQEDLKVKPFADDFTKAVLSTQLF